MSTSKRRFLSRPYRGHKMEKERLEQMKVEQEELKRARVRNPVIQQLSKGLEVRTDNTEEQSGISPESES